MPDIEAEKTNGQKIKIDLDPWEWLIIGVVVVVCIVLTR